MNIQWSSNMPVAAVVAVAAAETGVAAGIGSAVAESIVGAVVTDAVATAIGTGVISAGVTAAQGGDASDILKSAVVGGVASYAGGQVGGAAGEALPAGTSDTLSKAVSSAAASGTSNTLSALASGQNLQDALATGAKGAAVAGATAGTVAALKEATSQPVGGTGLKVPQAGQDSISLTGDFKPTGISTDVPSSSPGMGGGTGIYALPADLFFQRMSQYSTQQGKVSSAGDGKLQPAYQSAADMITPSEYQQYMDKYSQPEYVNKPMTESPIGKTSEKVLSALLSPAYSSLFGTSGSGSGGGVGGGTSVATTGAGSSPGSEALAQALRLDPGAPVFGGEKDKGKKSGWNVESLRYMGNSEA